MGWKISRDPGAKSCENLLKCISCQGLVLVAPTCAMFTLSPAAPRQPESCILHPQKDMPFVSVCICPNDKLHKRSRSRRPVVLLSCFWKRKPNAIPCQEPSQQRKSSWMRFKMLLNYFKTLQLRHASPPILHSITIGATWVLAIICKCCKKVDNAGEITFFGSQPAQK